MTSMNHLVVVTTVAVALTYPGWLSAQPQAAPGDGAVVKKVLDSDNMLGADQGGRNLLVPGSWRSWQQGYESRDGSFLCDNGDNRDVERGVSQTVVLNQTEPEPIVATAWSRAENVGGTKNSDYSLYLDLIYTDGTPLWGQVGSFDTGSHNWQKATVHVFPDKPVRSVSVHMLLRRHTGKAWFRNAQLQVVRAPGGAVLFDGVPVSITRPALEGFQLRDVSANGDFVTLRNEHSGIRIESATRESAAARFFDVTVSDTTGTDRCVTLVYSIPLPRGDCIWLDNPRTSVAVAGNREYVSAGRFVAGANGRLSMYPFAALTRGGRGLGIGIDMACPAFFRAGYNGGAEELFLAYDIGLTPQKPSARLRFCTFDFDGRWGFRAALQKYYDLFPEAFVCRIPKQGLWMPFARISEVRDWQDFGFRFKEGDNETAWDDSHDVLTFRYTEPMTWWMPMPADMPRTTAAALAEARRLADEKADPHARALLTSGFHDQAGGFIAQMLDTPWCNGAVWSINSMPGIKGEFTDFSNKWNPALRDKLYGAARRADLDGEYVDSSEGYVTDELDFRRDHLAAAETPLTFSLDSRKVAVFRGLIAFEYVRAIGRDVHAADRFMMANATPISLCWLAPLLDVMGSETDWNPGSTWRPMSDAELLYRRALCRHKPYCFLMNTRFEDFSHELVEKYMKRCLAYGMFPGFFSHNASQGHYFTRPELYDRDRDLFRKYVPLCRIVAEAGWEPITAAYSDNTAVHVERFGQRYLTVFNDSTAQQQATVSLEGRRQVVRCRELVHGGTVEWHDGKAVLALAGEDVALLDLDPASNP